MSGSTLDVSTPIGQINPNEAQRNASIRPKLKEEREHVLVSKIATPLFQEEASSSNMAPVTGTTRNTIPPLPELESLPVVPNQTLDSSLTSTDPNDSSTSPPDTSVMTEQSTPEAMIAFQDATAAFAVDVSWSTKHNGVLEQEKKAIRDLSEHLSANSKSKARILPWNSSAHPPTDLSDVSTLKPSGGTNPTVLNVNLKYQKILQSCSIWFLLTDGEIDQNTVKRFASGICERGLHGKACVVVLFGCRPTRPIHCNISVGQAIFASAPHCAFLFHDVEKEDVFVLQCKGRFRELLPQTDMEIVLDGGTDWKHLPTTTYDNLAQVSIPPPRKVAQDAIYLASGKVVSFKDLYHNRLAPEITAEIMSNDDNLKSVLLVAHNWGKSSEIRSWVSLQRLSRKPAAYVDRPDLDGKAYRLVKELVEIMASSPCDTNLLIATSAILRDTHRRNWFAFIESTKSISDQTAQRNTVVDSALSRVKLNTSSPGSPCMMSPVSPGGTRYREDETSVRLSRPPIEAAVEAPGAPKASYRRLRDRFLHSGSSSTVPRFQTTSQTYGTTSGQSIPYESAAVIAFPYNADLSTLLYMKGYKLGSGPSSPSPFCGICSLCNDDRSPLALLLKRKPADYSTEGGFPVPNSHAEIIFPLAMGNFPETDIVSSFICCEKCAYFISSLGRSPFDDSITGAIPLVPLSNEMNRQSFLKEIDSALEQRFDKSVLDQIFLSIICAKLNEVTTTNVSDTSLLVRALSWQRRHLSSQIVLPACLSSSFDPNDNPVRRPLSTTMFELLQSVNTSGANDFLQYPLDGFITLLEVSMDLSLAKPNEHVVRRIVFERFLYYIAEQQAMFCEANGANSGTVELCCVLRGEVGGLLTDSFCADVEALEGTHLWDQDAVDSFRRLRHVFPFVEQNCGVAIRFFLELLVNFYKHTNQEGREDFAGFEAIKERYAASLLFTSPWELKEDECRAILQGER